MKQGGIYYIKYALAVSVFSTVLLVCLPYLTSDFMDLRQQEENRLKFIAEEKIYLTGRFDPSTREDFVPVAPQYNLTPNKIYLRKETYEAFLDMRDSANKNGVDLKIASATRNFDYQSGIWNKKWELYSKSLEDGNEVFAKILEYSATPGISRHHWGTEIDINGASPEYFATPKGMKEYAWLVDNAPLFGFCQVYSQKGQLRPTGYNEEKWHWSYLPLAKKFTQEYKEIVQEKDINGFEGDEYAPNQNLINNYVLSINPECL